MYTHTNNNTGRTATPDTDENGCGSHFRLRAMYAGNCSLGVVKQTARAYIGTYLYRFSRKVGLLDY